MEFYLVCFVMFFFSSRRRHTRSKRDWSSDVCSSDLGHRQYNSAHGPREKAGQAEDREQNCTDDVPNTLVALDAPQPLWFRSEERRVGKECRSRWPKEPRKK